MYVVVVCVYVCMQVHIHVYTHVHGGERLILGVSPEHTPPYILRQSLTNLELTDLSNAGRQLALRCPVSASGVLG